MVDVLIAGGGIAGSALAILLGRYGFQVELFEKECFPREKACGEGLMPGGVAVIERMNLREALGGKPFNGVRYHFGSQTAEGKFPSVPGLPAVGYGQRRKHMDAVLFQAAAETAGVTVHSGVSVERAILKDGRVRGLSVQGESLTAKLVVGADGVHSRIRSQLGLDQPARRKRLGARAHFRLARGRPQPSWVNVFVRPRREIYVTPLPEDEILVAALVSTHDLKSSIDHHFYGWCQDEPVLHSWLEGAAQVTPLRCVYPLSGSARRCSGRGFVLLGDAAGFLDPITGGGMTQALMTAELLAGYVQQGLDDVDDWLMEFERGRREMLRDYRILTQGVLWLADHPKLTEKALSVFRISPSLLSHFIGVSGGMRPLLRRRRPE